MSKEKSLFEYLKKKQQERNQSSGFDFCTAYLEIKKYLEDHVYDNVELGAALHGDGLLTAHGKSHVEDVITKVELLLRRDFSKLNLHETFTLLLAILIHDIGNLKGRSEHEKKIARVINNCDKYKTLDSTIKFCVQNIALAHGGRTSTGDKDTISLVKREDGLGGENVRPRALAALLRFADELAEGTQRANIDMGIAGEIPADNLIYHKYAETFQSIMPHGMTLALKYGMQVSTAIQKFPKKEDAKVIETYLFDEIYDRLCKTACEMEYCVKHGGGLFHFEDISATITIFSNDFNCELINVPLRFKTGGYPRFDSNINLERPSDKHYQNGESLASHVKQEFSKELTVDV